MSAWVWIERSVILAIHEMQLAEHGGGNGIRDFNLLESALARPMNLAAYGEPMPRRWQRPMAMVFHATMRSSTATSERVL